MSKLNSRADKCLSSLARVAKKTKGTKWDRFLARPLPYTYAQWVRWVLYPRDKKGRWATTTCIWGDQMQVLLPAGADIYILGAKTHSSELSLSVYLCKYLRPGDYFIDAGAHFGFYSLLAAHLMEGKGKIKTIDASSQMHEVLKKNASHLPIVERIHAALCAEEQEAILFTEYPIIYSEYNTLHPEQYQSESWNQKIKGKELRVEAKTLDKIYYAENQDTNASIFIKIDVEGAEFEVLKGATTLLQDPERRSSIHLFLEYWAAERLTDQHRKALEFLQVLGYLPYLLDENGNYTLLENLNQIQDSENILFRFQGEM